MMDERDTRINLIKEDLVAVKVMIQHVFPHSTYFCTHSSCTSCNSGNLSVSLKACEVVGNAMMALLVLGQSWLSIMNEKSAGVSSKAE